MGYLIITIMMLVSINGYCWQDETNNTMDNWDRIKNIYGERRSSEGMYDRSRAYDYDTRTNNSYDDRYTNGYIPKGRSRANILGSSYDWE
jgi:hypothetical protein